MFKLNVKIVKAKYSHPLSHKHQAYRPYKYSKVTVNNFKEIDYEMITKDPYFKDIPDEELLTVIDYMDSNAYGKFINEATLYCANERKQKIVDNFNGKDITKIAKAYLNEVIWK